MIEKPKMFKLTEKHNQAFQAKAEADFVREVMQYLRENFPNSIPNLANNQLKLKDLDDGSLRLFCEIAIFIAKSKGIIGKKEVRMFISYLVMLGANFYKHELVRKYFLPFNTEPDKTIHNLLYFSEADWNCIREFSSRANGGF